MANTENMTSIPAPRVPFIDQRTGLISRDWYRFLLNIFQLTGSGGNDITLDDLQISPAPVDASEVAVLQTEIQGLQQDGKINSLAEQVAVLQTQIEGLYLLPAIDNQIPEQSTGGATWTSAEIDFGTAPAYSATFTIVDAEVSTSSKVVAVPDGATATGRVGNDWEWDGIVFACVPATGEFTLTALATPGPVVGRRKVYYQVGA